MVSDQLIFLLEFFISKIKIEAAAVSVPKFKDLSVHLFCDPFLDLKIITEEFDTDKDVQAANGEFKVSMGKTILFSSKSADLIRQMGQNSLEINLLISKKPAGSCTFVWRKEFIDMVNVFQSIRVVKSVNYEGAFDLMNSSRQKIGSIVLSVKMSCLGESVETYLNLQGKVALFVHPKKMQHVKCDKFEFTNDQINPISALYNPVMVDRPTGGDVKLSWNDLVGTEKDDDLGGFGKSASRQKPFETTSHGGSALDVISMVLRPPESKYIDFVNMLSADLETRDEETTINITIDRRNYPATSESGMRKKDQGSLLSVAGELTEERLKRKLCKNCDCEALKKFHEHGLGPRYRPSGLGTYYEICEPSTSYGMYHVFEDFSRYGSINFYRRPKDPYQKFCPGASKFHGPQRIKAKDLCYCPPLPDKAQAGDELCCCCKLHTNTRLRGGGKVEKKLCKLCKHIAERHAGQLKFPLRLRGGGGIIENNDERIADKPWDPVIKDIVKKIIDQVVM